MPGSAAVSSNNKMVRSFGHLGKLTIVSKTRTARAECVIVVILSYI